MWYPCPLEELETSHRDLIHGMEQPSYCNFLPAMEKLPSSISSISTFVESGFNEIKRSMENADADVYLWNSEELQDNKNYDSSITIEIPYGIAYSVSESVLEIRSIIFSPHISILCLF